VVAAPEDSQHSFLTATGAVLLAAPLAAEAQSEKVARLGFLIPGPVPTPGSLGNPA